MPIFSTWGRPIGFSTLTGAAVIPFPNLGIFREIRIVMEGLQHNSGTPDFLVQVSIDNGATYISTNYITNGATGTTGFIFATAVPVLTSVGGVIELNDFNVARPTWASVVNGGREGSGTGGRTASGRYSVAAICNALQIANSTGTNITSNTAVTLYGKQ